MKLQAAIDKGNTEKIVEIAESIHDVIDILEIGTPVLLREGTYPAKELKKLYPKLCILADSKIVDGGAIECEDLCKNGADIVTVLALAEKETIKEVVDTAHYFGKKVMADFICVENINEKAEKLLELQVDYCEVHTGVDVQKKGCTPLTELRSLREQFPDMQIAVAGGINKYNIKQYVEYGPEIIIAGKAIYQQENIRKAVLDLKQEMRL